MNGFETAVDIQREVRNREKDEKEGGDLYNDEKEKVVELYHREDQSSGN